ncbi:GPW/gp25 family protein [Pseudoalteromonas sp. McH1-7]|uniref:IraD/Gp25-like domain-containing protein n=1 Tax=Pseudoalteromonas peptidolytica F12-50-A1 TaxID=1315280 RepID=A0A8I0MXV6_9GAMM|nr:MULTISPECIES: GPW/gp25 family protein [Pseudoalteromonas]MBE0347841.1 hypothetical protein [Pseudoalteromonas peptidolytica F12-50-A1]MDW7551276.1 GPW/gp25 family protein [Pseudoalteromonas peptidolytica]NLR15251.1 hypothetical protein [Pseudoalteromonas peptidolytica]NUZ11891.1 GPW/gp25 family protein [Pseudoalteromonas sp. McH1-7]RRS09081.1 hypothetical protein EAG18_08150 [Pseudoalteromonas sp. J010]
MALYSDVNQCDMFTEHLVSDEESVQQALNNLFNTRLGERVFHPEYGMDIEHLLFEIMDDEIAFNIQHRLNNAITQFEPRVVIMSLNVEMIPDEHIYSVNLLYSIKGLGDRTFTFTKKLQTKD